MFLALVAELRMLSSGESSVMVSNPTIVKPEPDVNSSTETLSPSLLEPGTLFNEAYPDSLLTTLRRLVFDQPTHKTDMYRWKSLGYWLCSQLVPLLRSSDIFCQTVALKMLTDVSAAFLDSLGGIRQRHFITCRMFYVLKKHCIVKYSCLPTLHF